MTIRQEIIRDALMRLGKNLIHFNSSPVLTIEVKNITGLHDVTYEEIEEVCEILNDSLAPKN